MPHADGHTISWDVTTHVHKERTADWYWALGLIALVASGVAIWAGNLLFAIIIVLSAGSLGVLAARGPRQHSVHIDNKSISIDGTVYLFASLKSFWVDRHPEDPRLYLMTHGVMAPHIMLPLDSVAQAEQVYAHLRNKIDEEEQEPHFGEHLLELIGL